MRDIPIYILGRTNHEKGDNLETLTKELYARLGFGSFVRNAYKTGAEIDLRARHRVTDSPLLCECKATGRAIGTRPVKHFFAEWVKESWSEHHLDGIMVSTSGYIGTAQQWYQEMPEEKRRGFTLVGPDELLVQLIEADITLDPRAIESALSRKYSLGELYGCQLTYSKHGLAWIYIYEADGTPCFHTIVDGKAEPLPTWKCREIANLCGKRLSRTKLFGLDLRRKVQIELLKNEGQSTADRSAVVLVP